VKPGDIVDIGTPLAKSDNTGLSTGPHLHFGLKPLDKGTEDWDWNNLEQDNGYFGAVNPIPYFSGYYAEDMVAVVSLYERIIAAYRAAIQAFTR
jgi:murein DD-endopeptidase MepM/ murein hydrolase activator NlpD